MPKFFNRNWLFMAVAFLLVFIPLYPKLPLADIIPGYLVRIRLEDFAVLFVSLLWFVQFLRKKILWNTFFFWLMVAYLGVGGASVLSGLFLNHTIPFQILHLGKSGLHLFRYTEYFSLFVIGFAALTNPKQLNVLFRLLLVVVFAITVYGAGQKYLQWPVYSTMNREYSKGEALTLGEHAKVQSTFGGHYDLAAFLVIILPIIFVYFLSTNHWRAKVLIIAVELGGWWMLVLSGSKTSLLATALAHAIALLLYLHSRDFFKKINWLTLLKLSLGGVILLGGLLLAITTLNKDMAASFISLGTKIPVAGPYLAKFSTADNSGKPQDWIVAEPIYEEKKITLENGQEAIELVKKELEWSPNALKYGISMGIRLDTLWPNAVTSLRRNPYLGSSYGNLNKPALNEFTDSDSTDNNYLRTLGETGLLGFITFYGLIVFLIVTFFRVSKKTINPTTVYSQALIAGTIGLAFNALYIDVFAASKVAFIFWLLMGVTLKSIYLSQPELAKKLDHDRFAFLKKAWRSHWPLLIVALLLGLLTWRNPYLDEFTLLNKFNFAGADYQNLILSRCLAQQQSFSLCRPVSSGASGLPVNFSPVYALTLLPIYQIFSHPNAYYFVNYWLFNFTFFLVYLILRKIIKNRAVELVLLILFVLNPFLRETVLKSTSVNLLMLAVTLLVYLKLLLLAKFKRGLTVFLNHPITAFTLIVGGLFLTGHILAHHRDPFLMNFTQDERAHVYRTIKRANLSFTHHLKNDPYLITAINPYLFDLYGNANYQLLPYSPQQDLFASAQAVWGDLNFDYSQARQTSDLAPLYSQILTDHPLYFTNYAIGDFKELRRHFSFITADLDCDEHCNIYYLTPKTPLPKLIEPTVYNNISLGKIFPDLETRPEQKLSFTVVGHTYPDLNLAENQTPTGQAERYNELHLAGRLKQLLPAQSGFLIFLGDLTTRLEDSRLALFDRYLTADLTQALINAPSTLNPKGPQAYYQPFALGNNYFVKIKTLNRSKLEKDELIKFYNLYYDLEFSGVNYLFIFSYQDLRQNIDFMAKVVPLLNQLSEKSIYIFAGDGGVDGDVNFADDGGVDGDVIFAGDGGVDGGRKLTRDMTDGNPKVKKSAPLLNNLGNVTFVQTGFSATTPATVIQVQINPVTGVTLNPI